MDNTNKKQKAAFGRGTSTRAKQLAKAPVGIKDSKSASFKIDSNKVIKIFKHCFIIPDGVQTLAHEQQNI